MKTKIIALNPMVKSVSANYLSESQYSLMSLQSQSSCTSLNYMPMGQLSSSIDTYTNEQIKDPRMNIFNQQLQRNFAILSSVTGKQYDNEIVLIKTIMNFMISNVEFLHKDSFLKTLESVNEFMVNPKEFNPQLIQNPLEAHYAIVIFDLIQLLSLTPSTLDQYKEIKENKHENPHQVGIVFTNHPSRMKSANLYLKYGQLQNLIAKMQKHGVVQVEKLQQILLDIVNTNPLNRRPTLEEEVQTLDLFLERLERAVAKNLLSLDVHLHTWGGFDADRSSVTPEVMANTVVLNISFMNELYKKYVSKVQRHIQPGQIVIQAQLHQSMECLEGIGNCIKDAQILIRQMAALNIGNQSPTAQDNLEQFFGGSKEVLNQFMLQYGTSNGISQILKDFQYILQTIQNYTVKLFDCQQQAQILIHQRGLPTDQAYIKMDRVNKILNKYGFIPMSGQGRLDSQTSLSQTLQTLLPQSVKQELGLINDRDEKDQFLTSFLVDNILHNDQLIDLSKVDKKAFFVINYLNMIGAMNSINDKYMATIIIANYENVSDFLTVFFLAKQVGLIKMDNGHIVESKIRIMPLVESVEEHYRAGDNFQKLLSIPFIKEYFEKLEGHDFRYMKAYSDTSRFGGIPAGVASLLITPFSIQQQLKPFGIPVTFFHGVGSHMLRCGGSGVDRDLLNVLSLPEKENSWQTLQPGRLEPALMNKQHTLIFLEQMVKGMETPTTSMTLEFAQFMQQLTQPGLTLYEEILKDRHGDFNELLHNNPLVDIIVNRFPLGSRMSKVTNLAQDQVPVMISKRAITVTGIFEQLGVFVSVITPFVLDIDNFVKTNDIGDLKVQYQTNTIFRFWLDKIAELFLMTSMESFEHLIGKTSPEFLLTPFYQQLKQDYAKGLSYLKEILGIQPMILDDNMKLLMSSLGHDLSLEETMDKQFIFMDWIRNKPKVMQEIMPMMQRRLFTHRVIANCFPLDAPIVQNAEQIPLEWQDVLLQSQESKLEIIRRLLDTGITMGI